MVVPQEQPEEFEYSALGPKLTLYPPTPEGVFILEFDQDMVAPKMLDPTFYPRFFQFRVKSHIDDSFIIGTQHYERSRLLRNETVSAD